jgi:hypothetical protein
VAGLLIVQLAGGAVSLSLTPATGAAGCLAAFAFVELASVIWAGDKGDAWDAANLTFVYAFVLLLFAGFRGGVASRQALVALFAIVMPRSGSQRSSRRRATSPVHSSSIGWVPPPDIPTQAQHSS